MSTVVDKPRTTSTSGLTGGAWPQVNLLPPEVTAARGLRAVKRWLVVAILVVLVVCAGSYGLAVMVQSNADAELAEVQNTTVGLQAEVAKYADVPRVRALLTAAEDARDQALADEVIWGGYVAAIAVTLPGEVRLEGVAAAGRTPMSGIAASTDPLVDSGVGRLTMVARTPVIPDAAAWVDALDALPGLANTRVGTAEIAEADGTVFYRTNVTVEVTADALATASADEETGS